MTYWQHGWVPDGAWIDPPPGMQYIPEPPKPNTGVQLRPACDILYHPESDCFFVGDLESCGDSAWELNTVDPTLLRNGTPICMTWSVSTVHASFDFETYSPAGYETDPATGRIRGIGSQGKGGLGVVGTANYISHRDTEVLSLYYDLKDGKGRRHWAPGFPDPVDLLDYIARGGIIEAWNVTFEYWVWNVLCVRRYGWPVLQLSQCRCAMAKARRYSLPGSLANAAAVLGTPGKDSEGSRLIQKLTRPHTPTQKRKAIRWTPATAWDDFVGLYTYNGQDVVAEDHAAARIPDLSAHEHAIWQLDQTINLRGVGVDVETLDAALDILEQAERRYTEELFRITEGHVTSVSEVAKMGEWLAAKGVGLANLKKESVAEALKRPDLPKACRRALEIRESLGAANVKKLRKLKVQVSADGRLRNQYMYCGADRTGRWSSAAADDDASNAQLQNITAKGPKTCRCEGCHQIFGQEVREIGCPRCGSWMFHELPEWDIEAVEQAIADIRSRSLDWVERVWGDAIVALCGCLRGLFVAREGYEFVCVDFSAIEAVVQACLARCQWRIEVFSTHAKIYEASAAKATGIPFEEILDYKKRNGMHHPMRKKVGKVRELAGGFGGWIQAWKNFGADDFFTNDEDIKADVLKWRDESPEIVEMWGGQFRWCGPGKWDYRPELFGLEGAFIAAVQNPGQWFTHNDISYVYRDDIVFCRLPSGRDLHYHRPRLVPAVDKLNRGPCLQITFEGYNSNSQKGPVGWVRMETFGGRLFENVVQAVGRDIHADFLLNAAAEGYDPVMHTHDEGCAEVPIGWGSVDHLVSIACRRPAWASWWPIRAAGWRHRRYQKD